METRFLRNMRRHVAKKAASERKLRHDPERLTTLASGVQFSGGNTFLHRFAMGNSDSEDYINAMLRLYTHVPANSLNDEGYSALHLAVLNNNLLMVRKLLSCLENVDVNARRLRESGNTALHMAAGLGHLPIIRVLFDCGASVDVRNHDEESPLFLAVKLGRFDVAEFLLSEGADVNLEGCNGPLLCWAAWKAKFPALEFLVSHGADVSNRNGRKRPLGLAAQSGNYAVVEWLVRNGAEVNAKDGYDGFSPLHHAAASKNIAVVDLLTGNGADVNALAPSGRNPLHWAVYGESLEMVQKLVDQGADIHAADVNGKTVLHCAAQGRNVEIVKLLIDRGADFLAVDRDGKTMLHEAAYRNNLELIKLLVDKGADVNPRDKKGRTPRDYAHNFARDFVLCQGPNFVYTNFFNPLKTPEYRIHVEIDKVLADKGAKFIGMTLFGCKKQIKKVFENRSHKQCKCKSGL